jgi:hypothetical protein
MKPSPVGSKILSAYAVLFVGLAPIALSVTAIANGLGLQSAASLTLSASVVFYGIHVFRGEVRYIRVFAILVMLHYFGVSLANILNYSSYPEDTRAFQMAIPRIIRGVLFASFYGWYYFLRKKTRNGFTDYQGANT